MVRLIWPGGQFTGPQGVSGVSGSLTVWVLWEKRWPPASDGFVLCLLEKL